MKKLIQIILITLILLISFFPAYAVNIVRFGPEYIPQYSAGRPLAFADIYVGEQDTDPTVVGNQKQLYIQEEDGTFTAIAQPITTGAGGIPLYSGDPVTLYVSGSYSITVLSSDGSQIYYNPNVIPQYEPGITIVPLLSGYLDLADAVTTIGATPTELWIDEDAVMDENVLNIPTTLKMKFIEGNTITTTGYTLGFAGGPQDHIIALFNQDCFDGTGTVTWGAPGTIEQGWFGNTDADLVVAVGSLIEGCVWHLLAGTYTQTTQITLPDGLAAMKGDGQGITKINSTVSADWAIIVGSATATYEYETVLSDFYLLGDMASGAASTGLGGIKYNGSGSVVTLRVRSEGFGEGGWTTAGNPVTEATAAGFWVSGTVGVKFEDCYARRNDVGFLVDKGAASVNTTTTFNECTAKLNRTHGIKWTDTMTTVWDGGVIESNNGLITVEINCTGDASGNEIRKAHFESNQRISGAAAVGSRDINITSMNTIFGLTVDNILFNAGVTYPETIMEIADCRLTRITNSTFALGGAGTDTLEINSDCTSTQLRGNHFSTNPTDNGVNTIYGDRAIGFGDSADLSGETPSVSSDVYYAKAPAITITNLTNGLSGQVIILEGQYGTVLHDNTNFLLKNGGDFMALADGSIVRLRKDVTSSKWVLIGHEPSVAIATLSDNATQYIDDRDTYYVPDACTTPIATLSEGYPGQLITFLSIHTGANTTDFTDTAIGTGNEKMAMDGNFTMAAGGQITFRYNKSESMWIEISRNLPG